MAQSHRAVCETWFRRVWWEQDETAIDEMLLPESRAEGLSDPDGPAMVGPEAFKIFHRSLLALIDRVEVIIERMVSEGECVSLLIHVRATCRRTGKPVEMRGHVMLRIVDGRLVEGHNHIDFIALFEQLDLMPADTLSTCLSGRKIG
ncbi:MAG: nuclear transport factor 2 family protein [Pseudomonadota bacterium]